MWIKTVTAATIAASCAAVVALPSMTSAAPAVRFAKGPASLRPVVPALGVKISRITVVHRGFVAVPNATILAILSQKVGGQYDEAAAQQDTKTLKSFGAFRGDVIENASADPHGGVDLIYTVTENPFIKTIQFTANTPDGQPSIPAAVLRSQMKIQDNGVLSTVILMHDMNTLLNHTDGVFWTQGLLADSGVTRIDPVTETLTIQLLETHIAKIQIQGNTQVPTEEIMQQIQSKPGDLFNAHLMQADMTRVWHMGKFNTVGPLTETIDEDHQMTVIIPVTEKKSILPTN